MRIRRFRIGEERALFEIYYSAIHRVACRDYTQEQVEAWAPADLDQALWSHRIRDINPFVAELDETLVGYADIQASGYIDHFFVSGQHPRQGIGAKLMATLHQEAARIGVTELTSDVSKTAQPFFEKFGFAVVEHRLPALRGVVIPNARMSKVLSEAAA